jgi:hypothetical protein
MEQFLTDLALSIGHKDCQISGDTLILTYPFKNPGTHSCINRKEIYIHPVPDRKHQIDIEEIWVGFDAEGYPWSDHMGGVYVDCTGMNVKTAISAITEKVFAKLAE